MRKVVGLLLVIAMMAACLTASVMATGDPRIFVGSTAAACGDEITLTVSIENNPAITNGKFEMEFNADVFEMVRFDMTGSLLQTSLYYTNGNAMNFMCPIEITKDGVLFSVVLKVKENAASGDYAVKVNVEYIDNNTVSSIPHQVGDGTVHVCQMTDVAEAAATCTANGIKAHCKCACGKSYVDGAEVAADSLVIPAFGHSYGTPVFAWAEDFSCNATYGCANCGETNTVPCQVAEQTVAPTCAQEGKTVYTATVAVEGNTFTDTKEVVIEKLTTHTDADGNILCDVCGFLMGEVKVEVKEELTDEDVPEELQQTEFDTIEKIAEEMVTQVQEELKAQLENMGSTGEVTVEIKPENTHLVDVVLMYQDQDGNMQEADQNHFPEDGKLTVTLPVPAGTNPETHKYHVVHMFTTSAFGKNPGDVEIFTDLVAQPDGNGGWCITFEVTGLSPIMICTEQRGKMGDVNGDGKVNTADAKLIMRCELGLIEKSELNTALADVNGDGKINTADAKLVMKYELGLITEFPVEKTE